MQLLAMVGLARMGITLEKLRHLPRWICWFHDTISMTPILCRMKAERGMSAVACRGFATYRSAGIPNREPGICAVVT
jgi:hypothetical protein